MLRREVLDAIDGAPMLQAPDDVYGMSEGVSAVKVATIEDLGRLLTEVSTEMNLSPYWADSTRGHERRHAQAALQLGASEIDFRLHFTRYPSADTPEGILQVGAATLIQFREPQPPLTLALIASYPNPSKGDSMFVSQLGYQDVDEVADIARRLNKNFGFDYPIPSWARAVDWTPDQTRNPANIDL